MVNPTDAVFAADLVQLIDEVKKRGPDSVQGNWQSAFKFNGNDPRFVGTAFRRFRPFENRFWRRNVKIFEDAGADAPAPNILIDAVGFLPRVTQIDPSFQEKINFVVPA